MCKINCSGGCFECDPKSHIEDIALNICNEIGPVAMCKDPIRFALMVVDRVDEIRGKGSPTIPEETTKRLAVALDAIIHSTNHCGKDCTLFSDFAGKVSEEIRDDLKSVLGESVAVWTDQRAVAENCELEWYLDAVMETGTVNEQLVARDVARLLLASKKKQIPTAGEKK